ncbi:MAG: cell division protein FtsQ/DivIB [bacterium]
MRVAGKYVFLSTSIILVILHLSVWIQDNHAFSVKKIIVTGNNLIHVTDVLSAAKIDSAESIWDTDIELIQERLADLPQVQSANITRLFPSNILIHVQERKPVAIIISNGLWGIDREGVLLPQFRANVGLDFPVITRLRLKEQIPGTKVDNSKVIALANFLGELQASGPVIYNLISEVTMNESYGVKAITVEKNMPIYFGKKNLLGKSKKLKAAWEYLASENKLEKILYLDLRFDGQVIAKQKTKSRTHT